MDLPALLFDLLIREYPEPVTVEGFLSRAGFSKQDSVRDSPTLAMQLVSDGLAEKANNWQYFTTITLSHKGRQYSNYINFQLGISKQDEIIDSNFKKVSSMDSNDPGQTAKYEFEDEPIRLMLISRLITIDGDYIKMQAQGYTVLNAGGWIKYKTENKMKENEYTDGDLLEIVYKHLYNKPSPSGTHIRANILTPNGIKIRNNQFDRICARIFMNFADEKESLRGDDRCAVINGNGFKIYEAKIRIAFLDLLSNDFQDEVILAEKLGVRAHGQLYHKFKSDDLVETKILDSGYGDPIYLFKLKPSTQHPIQPTFIFNDNSQNVRIDKDSNSSITQIQGESNEQTLDDNGEQ